MADTLIQTLLDKDYHTFKKNVMSVVENKIREKIDSKKEEVIEKINSSK